MLLQNVVVFPQNKSFFISFRFNLTAIKKKILCKKYHAFSPDLQKTATKISFRVTLLSGIFTTKIYLLH